MARVTDSMVFAKGKEAVFKQREKLIKNQEAAVSGKIVQRPSDNPVNAMRAMGLNAQMKKEEQVSTNMEMMNGMLTISDSTLGELSDVLIRAKELAIQMSSSTNAGAETRLSVSNEVDQLFMRSIQLGNTRFGDRYVFGGYQTDKAPFDTEGNYYGDNGSFEIEIDKGQKTAVMVPGTFSFLGIREFPAEGQVIRDNPALGTEATIKFESRAPASLPVGDDGKPLLPDKADRDKLQREKDEEIKMNGADGKRGVNVFRSLKSLGDGLRGGDMNAVHRAIDEMDDAFSQILQTRTLIGAKQNIFKSGLDSLESSKVNNADQLSKVQDADMLNVFSDLSRNEQALNATLEVSKKLITPSLIDFLK